MGERQLTSLLVEGGQEVITSFLKEDLVDRLIVIVAPRIIGEGKGAVGDLGTRFVEEAKKFTIRRILKEGTDRVFICEPTRNK